MSLTIGSVSPQPLPALARKAIAPPEPAPSCLPGDGVTISQAAQAAPASTVSPGTLKSATALAQSATAAALPSHFGYTALVLSDASRKTVLETIHPQWRPVCDHVTLDYGVGENAPLPSEAHVRAIGYATDGHGVEALVVNVNGHSERPDGSTYHVTLSLGDGRKAVESNDVIKEDGYTPIKPFDLQTEARFIPLAKL